MYTAQSPFPYRLAYIALIACICAIGFRGLPSQPWSYDDFSHIVKARDAQNNLLHIFSAGTIEPTRIVLHLYFYLTYKVFGEAPAGYHTANILFHILNSLLCARLFQVLFQNSALAALCGFLFAINCTHYEAVYEISAAGLLFGTSFALLSVFSSLKYLASERWRHILGAAGAYTAAILSYESLVSVFLPIAFLCWARKGKLNRSSVFLLTALLAVVGLFVLVDTAVYRTIGSKSDFNIMALGFHVPYNLAFYVGRLLVNAHFTPFGWDGPAPFDVPRNAYDWYVVGGGLFLVLLLYASRRQNPVRFWAVWIVATVLPYTLGTGYSYFPRYWYLPAIGGAAISAQLILWIYSHTPLGFRLRICVLTTILILLTVLSLHKMKVYEGRFLVHAANFYSGHRQDYTTAITYYTRARSEYQMNTSFNLGVAYLNTNRLEEALRMFRETSRVRPAHIPAIRNVGYVLYKKGEIKESIEVLKKAAALDSTDAETWCVLAHVQRSAGNLEDAHAAILKALAKDSVQSDYWIEYFNIGGVYHTQGQIDKALAIYQDVVQAIPDSTNVHINLSILHYSQGRYTEAASSFQQAIRLSPDDWGAHLGLAQSYEKLNRIEDAIQVYKKALSW